MYDTEGHMSVQIMQRDRPRFSNGERDTASAGEAKAAFDSYIGYYGTYEVNPADKTPTYRIQGSSLPNWTGTTLIRTYEASGKRMRRYARA